MAVVREDDIAEGFMAMTVGDDIVEIPGSSLTINSVESKQNGHVLSPEDLNWADSCLVKNEELSETNWTSLFDALAEALNSHPDNPASSESEENVVPRGIGIEISAASEETGPTENLEGGVYYYEPSQPNGVLESRNTYMNAFLPTYKEGDIKEVGNSDADVVFSFPVVGMESRPEDIFKVWDLDIPAEEDEFSKQLKRALSVDTSKSVPSDFDDSGSWKEVRGESVDVIDGILDLSLDDLISGISDLSLAENSG